MTLQRLQKLISQAGVTSRRDAEAFIKDGRVSVNGKVVTELGAKADPDKDRVSVDGEPLGLGGPRVVIMLHKPEKTIVTTSDPQKRLTVMSLLEKPAFAGRGPRKLSRVFPIGRLDYDSQGLLLFTNDGDLAERIMHPRFHVPKTYLVKVTGVVDDKGLRRIEQGILLKDEDGTVKKTQPAIVELHRRTDRHAWYAVTVFEGRNRLLKRLFMAVGHPVRRILRITFAGLQLGDLPEGEWRELDEHEEANLRQWLDPERAEKMITAARQSHSLTHSSARPPARRAHKPRRGGEKRVDAAGRGSPRTAGRRFEGRGGERHGDPRKAPREGEHRPWGEKRERAGGDRQGGERRGSERQNRERPSAERQRAETRPEKREGMLARQHFGGRLSQEVFRRGEKKPRRSPSQTPSRSEARPARPRGRGGEKPGGPRR